MPDRRSRNRQTARGHHPIRGKPQTEISKSEPPQRFTFFFFFFFFFFDCHGELPRPRASICHDRRTTAAVAQASLAWNEEVVRRSEALGRARRGGRSSARSSPPHSPDGRRRNFSSCERAGECQERAGDRPGRNRPHSGDRCVEASLCMCTCVHA